MRHAKPFVVVCLAAATSVLALACGRKEVASPAALVDALRAAYAKTPDQWPAPTLDAGVPHRELASLDADAMRAPSEAYAYIAVADERALIDLGKQLFFDPRLSASNQISCSSCHDPDLAWGDGRRRSFGHDRNRGSRNAPSILNAGHWETLFWDGRAKSLEDQTLGPLQDQMEMMQTLDELGPELAAIAGYPPMFAAALGSDSITTRRISLALAAFERTIDSRTSRFDLFVKGKHDALSDEEIRGLHLFRTKARCINCHNGPLFSDQQFHNNGQSQIGRDDEDLGRYTVTGDWEDAGAFRTPSLRDVMYTGPYFHNGNIAELREILQMYNGGMPQVISRRVMDTLSRVPIHDPLLKPLGLTDAEMDDLTAFMEAISTRPVSVRVPEML